jgi:hypothetical protein
VWVRFPPPAPTFSAGSEKPTARGQELRPNGSHGVARPALRSSRAGSWHPGRRTPSIVFSVAEGNLACLRTDVGGAFRWDDHAQRWVALQDGQSQNSYMGVESIAPDPVDPNIVYLATGMYFGEPAAIMRSADRGASWQVTPVPFSMGGNEDGRGLGERLAIDPDRRTHLFFGSRHDGLWYSEDSGRTWHKVERFLWKGLGRPATNRTHGGVSFVIFGPSGGTGLGPSRAIYAGVAAPLPFDRRRAELERHYRRSEREHAARKVGSRPAGRALHRLMLRHWPERDFTGRGVEARPAVGRMEGYHTCTR